MDADTVKTIDEIIGLSIEQPGLAIISRLEELERRALADHDTGSLKSIRSLYARMANVGVALNKPTYARYQAIGDILAGKKAEESSQKVEIDPEKHYTLDESVAVLTRNGLKYKAVELQRMVYAKHLTMAEETILGSDLLRHKEFMKDRHFLGEEPEGFYESALSEINQRRKKHLKSDDLAIQVKRGATTLIGHQAASIYLDRMEVIEPKESLIEMVSNGLWLSAEELIQYGSQMTKPEILAVMKQDESFKYKNSRPIIGYVSAANLEKIGLSSITDLGYLLEKKEPKVKEVGAPVDIVPEKKADLMQYEFNPEKMYARQEAARKLKRAGVGMFVEGTLIDEMYKILGAKDNMVGGDVLIKFIEEHNGALNAADPDNMAVLALDLDLTPEQMQMMKDDINFKQYRRSFGGVDYFLMSEVGEMNSTLRDLGVRRGTYEGLMALEKSQKGMDDSQIFRNRLAELRIMPSEPVYNRMIRSGVFDHSSPTKMRHSYERYEREMKGHKFFNLGKMLEDHNLAPRVFYESIGPDLTSQGILKDLTAVAGKKGDAVYVLNAAREVEFKTYFLRTRQDMDRIR